MDETYATIGILVLSVIAVTGYIIIESGNTGAAITQNYISCCCNILTDQGDLLVRSQIQTFEDSCNIACQRYTTGGRVFSQEGLCTLNP
ncbi:hypothetical protein COV18_03195 [Candidatus Woesearchaeota archaeon CG10_big_fil_rev_8_21_14_0_10_37_12]|nr:MAG: hypothetical protein COV18_03195 [Candidatus Woesearchaeota archaeon CG10_big_fil_rev_8_21_14_0_10_37_12]